MKMNHWFLLGGGSTLHVLLPYLPRSLLTTSSAHTVKYFWPFLNLALGRYKQTFSAGESSWLSRDHFRVRRLGEDICWVICSARAALEWFMLADTCCSTVPRRSKSCWSSISENPSSANASSARRELWRHSTIRILCISMTLAWKSRRCRPIS